MVSRILVGLFWAILVWIGLMTEPTVTVWCCGIALFFWVIVPKVKRGALKVVEELGNAFVKGVLRGREER